MKMTLRQYYGSGTCQRRRAFLYLPLIANSKNHMHLPKMLTELCFCLRAKFKFYQCCSLNTVNLCATDARIILPTNKNICVCFEEMTFHFSRYEGYGGRTDVSLLGSVPPTTLRATDLEFVLTDFGECIASSKHQTTVSKNSRPQSTHKNMPNI